MWRNKKVMVLFPTYNEKDSIKDAIDGVLAEKYIDEVVVVNNNAVSGTDEEVKKTKAKLVFEKKQGYGYATRRGLREILDLGADLIIISEPDGTFAARDVLKLLTYSDDFEVVFGTRTNSTLILEGANMGLFLKFGNYAVSKIVEFLFNTPELSDVGCTLRLLHRHVLEKVMPLFKIGGSHFGPEIMLTVIRNNFRFIEIPVNYGKRVGKSSVTGSKRKAFVLGIRMLLFVLKVRLISIFNKGYYMCSPQKDNGSF